MSNKIVVAIDLGTSRSAYTYSIQGQAEEDVIIRVPGGSLRSMASMKTDTAVLLSSTHPHDVLAFGRSAYERFMKETVGKHGASDHNGGVSALTTSGPTAMLFRWFKMGLCERRGYISVAEPVATAEGGQQLPLMVVMTAVLRHFKRDAISHLSSVSEVAQTVDDVMWVVTIPAIYEDFAKRFTRVAAHNAGIISTVDSSSLQLCLEPEAACLAVFSKDSPDLAQAGTKVMVLDCGGGTVDITTHAVLSMNPLRLKELLPPTGGPWGSTCVDQAFMRWFKDFLGEQYYSQVRRTFEFYNLLNQWEEGKTRFGGGKKDRVRLNMVDISRQLGLDVKKLQELRVAYNDPHESPQLRVKGSKYFLVLPSPLVRSFFAPTIANMVKCLHDIKRHEFLRNLRYVFLVGGFSSSPLIQAAARGELEAGGCEVLPARRPDVAIVRGASLFANNAEVFATRKARLTYGVVVNMMYDRRNPEHVRRRSNSPVFGENGEEKISAFYRHITAGQDIPHDGVCPAQVYRPTLSTQSEISFSILASHSKNIEFPDKDTTFSIGRLCVPLDMTTSFKNRRVEVQFVSGGTEFSVNCFSKATGERIGKVALLSLVQEVQDAA